jgi:hypothetical protein
MIADAESVLILIGPTKGCLDDTLQVGQRTPGGQFHPAPDLRIDLAVQCGTDKRPALP